MIEICFVCTGNTCRSVMAERIAKKMAKSKNVKNVKFSSAGIYAKGDQIAENASLALKEMGYDGRPRKSVKLKKIKPNVIYVAVTSEHKKFIQSDRCLSLDELYCAVPDPYGQSLEVYKKCALLLEKNVETLLEKLKNLRGVK